MKKILLLSLVSILFLYGCSTEKTTENTSADLVVAASFYPLYDFASNVVGGEGEVISITPNGTEPHDFEPTPKDLAKIYSSKLFIYNGSGMDPWAEKIAADLESKGVKTLEMSQFVDLLAASHEDEHSDEEEAHSDEDEDTHDETSEKHSATEDEDAHGDFDPHFWLDPVIAQTLVKEIAAELQLLDPTKSNVFKENSDNFVAELETLVTSYKEGLASCDLKTTVASHAAFNYLANRFGFEVISIAGISPEEEPSPARLAEITTLVKSKGVKYIFFETLVSPKIAETIAKEAGVETLVFNPLEGLTQEQIDSNQNYLSIMSENLDNLRTALSCK